MEELLRDKELLIARVQQVEHERDELRKDIEQLCMQQAGPSYIAVATRMHFQRTAALEQEIEKLRIKLASCSREKSNLEEELSQAYHIKGQLADLHAAEVSKNLEAEKQLKFFQSCVASAFAERDHSIMEAEKAKEKVESMAEKLDPLEKMVEELTRDAIDEKRLRDSLQSDLEKQSNQNEIFKKVINRFYEIRQYSLCGSCEDIEWEDRCECLLRDSPEKWDFIDQGETPSSKYISALEAEVQALRKSLDNIQSKLRVVWKEGPDGMEIETHLKKRVHDLEKKRILLEEVTQKGISKLLYCHSQHKDNIRNILTEECSYVKTMVDVISEKLKQLDESKKQTWESLPKDMMDENVIRDLHVDMVAVPELIDEKSHDLVNSVAISKGDGSEALAQALHEKVSALLLLSQQEERHLLERNVNLALQKKIEELQRNLLQVTNEKVKALMEFAQLKQEYQRLQEGIDHETRQQIYSSGIIGKKNFQETDGKLKTVLRKTYLNRWIGSLQSPRDTESYLKNTVDGSSGYNIDIARMKIDNATLKESLESMEHLTSAVRRLRLSLSKVKESISSREVTMSCTLEAVKDIIYEANLVKTALSSSLPVSWSAEAASNIINLSGDNNEKATTKMYTVDGGDIDSSASSVKTDFVSAAGYEMVEILIFAAQMLNDNIISKNVENKMLISHRMNP